jgi:hypothetical protein
MRPTDTQLKHRSCRIVMMLGRWTLGKPVSLSPIEVAKAFSARSLNDAEPIANIDGLLKGVGHRRIRNEVERNEASEAIIQMVKIRGCVKLQEGQDLH